MALMEWNEKLSVGVAAIDAEHKKLVSMLNALYDGIQAKHSKEALGHVLDGLINYTASHFKHEETLFAKTGYAAAAEHKKEHDDLTRQVLEVKKKYQEGTSAALPIEVMNFLRKWLLTHIQGSDKKYGPHLNAKGIK
jgi:hemerythrin